MHTFEDQVLDKLARRFVQLPSWCVPLDPSDDVMLADLVQAPSAEQADTDSSSSSGSSSGG